MMTSSNWIGGFSSQLGFMVPILLVQLLGLVLAMARWRRHPSVSAMFLGAMVLMLVAEIVWAFVFAWLPTVLTNDMGWTMSQVGFVLGAIGFGRTLIVALGWGLVLYSVFAGRSGLAKAVRPDDGHRP